MPGSTEGGASSEIVNSILSGGLKITNKTDPASSSIDNVFLRAMYSGTNDLVDHGFIWSQDYSKAGDLIANGTIISLGANKQESTLTDYGAFFNSEILATELNAAKEIIYFLPYMALLAF